MSNPNVDNTLQKLYTLSMEPFTLVIFGATGNLAKIKLFPALYDLAEKNMLPKHSMIIGIGRKPWTTNEFRDYIHKVLHEKSHHHNHPIKHHVHKTLSQELSYLQADIEDYSTYSTLQKIIQKHPVRAKNVIYYLATFPELYSTIFKNLERARLNKQSRSHGWVRIVVEKPLGTNLKSSRQLNKLLSRYFVEDQIYRLDHYLGKETLQNIITFRFGNDFFEPLINNKYLDSIQTTAAEDFGIGLRGNYYDTVGALKDVGQNHCLQMLALTTMDNPGNFDNKSITQARMKLIESLKPIPPSLVLGQYKGYTSEKFVDKKSTSDTFFALKTAINNSRFKGVPIYMRAGKKLKRTVTEISFVFKPSKKRVLKKLPLGLDPNVLIYRIQPNEGIVLKILTKTPGHTLELKDTYMQFCYKDLAPTLPDAYERLIVDVLRGDQTFFNDAEEVELQWKFIDEYSKHSIKPVIYKPGTWGPKESDMLLKEDERSWLIPSTAFCPL